MRRTTTRGLLGLTTAFAVLMALAAPASASPGTITGGSASVTTVNPIEVYDFDLAGGPPAGAPCPDKDGALDVNFTTNTVTAGFLGGSQVQVPAGSGNWYWMNVSVTSGTFVINMGPPATVAATVSLRITLHPIGSCDPKSTAVCTLASTLTLGGTWSGATASPPGVATLSGGPFNIVRAGACAAPFATRFPSAAPFAQFTITGMTVSF